MFANIAAFVEHFRQSKMALFAVKWAVFATYS